MHCSRFFFFLQNTFYIHGIMRYINSVISSCFATSFLSFYLSLCVLPSLCTANVLQHDQRQAKMFSFIQKRSTYTRDHGRRRQHAIIFVLVIHTHIRHVDWYQQKREEILKRRQVWWLCDLNWIDFFCVCFVCMKEKKTEFPLENRMLYILW